MERVELESMKGAELIAYADKLGVKVSCNKERTSLKESKAKVIDKIVAFETEHTAKEEKVERHLVPMPGIEKLEGLRKEYLEKGDDNIDLKVKSFCENNKISMHIGSKKNLYYIKLNSKTLKLRVTKKNYICYKSGKYDNGTYEEKSNRTKYVLTSLTDLLTLA